MVPEYGICLLGDTCAGLLILSAVAKEGSTIIADGRFEVILLDIGGEQRVQLLRGPVTPFSPWLQPRCHPV